MRSGVAGGGGFFELLHFALAKGGIDFEAGGAGDVEPRVLGFGELVVIEAEGLEDAGGHHHIAGECHVDAVAGEGVFAGGVGFFDGCLHVAIEVGEQAIFFFRKGAEELVVGDEFLIVWVRLILANHGRGQEDDFHVRRLGFLDDAGDVFLVVFEGDSVGAVPDVVDAATESHPLRFFAEHIVVEAGEHLIGFVAADASADDFNFYFVGGEGVTHEIDVTAGFAFPSLRDGVAEEGEFFARLDGDFCEGGGEGESEEGEVFHGEVD